jgi:hypothetical protein
MSTNGQRQPILATSPCRHSRRQIPRPFLPHQPHIYSNMTPTTSEAPRQAFPILEATAFSAHSLPFGRYDRSLEHFEISFLISHGPQRENQMDRQSYVHVQPRIHGSETVCQTGADAIASYYQRHRTEKPGGPSCLLTGASHPVPARSPVIRPVIPLSLGCSCLGYTRPGLTNSTLVISFHKS